MQPEELKETFNQQASGYDDQAAKVAPIYHNLHFLLEAVFSELPTEASVLCVGIGTGAELVHLVQKFPRLSLRERCSKCVVPKRRKWALLSAVISTKVT